MPTMIPYPISGTAPESEKMVFETFKYATNPMTSEWVVLHSVEISAALKIDFVILDKICKSIICLQFGTEKQGDCTTTQRHIIVETVVKSLKKHFAKSYFRDDSPLALGYATVYRTREQLNELPEHLEFMFDGKKFPVGLTLQTEYNESCDALNPETLSNVLVNYTFNLQTFENISTEKEDKNAQSEMDKLQSDLESTAMTTTTIYSENLETLRQELKRLTTEQFNSLKRLKINPRCVIDGAAGTGKTVLAMELARQRCEEGENVALLCSNPNLSSRFERWSDKLSKNSKGTITVGTPVTLPSSIFGNQDLFGYDAVLGNRYAQRVKASDKVLEKTLKEGSLNNEWEQFIEDTIADLGSDSIFDYLIVDEAQNLCAEVFLKLMNTMLKDGLTKGRWTMFGDFKNQNILCIDNDNEALKVLENFGLGWSQDELEINCRNTNPIADTIKKLAEVSSLPMSGVHGPLVQIKYFSSQEEDLGNTLDNVISTWKNLGYKSNQIVLLSSSQGTEFDTQRLYGEWELLNINEVKEDLQDDPIIHGGPSQTNTLMYSDVHDFQGLESDLAILVMPKTPDMVELAGSVALPREKYLNKVLYTGMSRAKTMLIVVADNSYKKIIEDRLL